MTGDRRGGCPDNARPRRQARGRDRDRRGGDGTGGEMEEDVRGRAAAVRANGGVWDDRRSRAAVHVRAGARSDVPDPDPRRNRTPERRTRCPPCHGSPLSQGCTLVGVDVGRRRSGGFSPGAYARKCRRRPERASNGGERQVGGWAGGATSAAARSCRSVAACSFRPCAELPWPYLWVSPPTGHSFFPGTRTPIRPTPAPAAARHSSFAAAGSAAPTSRTAEARAALRRACSTERPSGSS